MIKKMRVLENYHQLAQMSTNAMKLYILATLISFASCQYWNIVCETDPDLNIANCTKDRTPSAYISTLPIDTIPLGVKSLIFANKYSSESDRVWQINDHRMFHGFENLTELLLKGPVIFSETYYERYMKSKLIDELFQLPRLTTLTLEEWEPYFWKFSNTLQTLKLKRFDRAYFDLDTYPNLISIYLAESQLKKFTPPASLEDLIIINNSDIEFNVYDIVGLCKLKNLSINLFNENFERTEKYCECKRLQAYMIEFQIKAYKSISCDDVQADCKGYSLEKPKKIHRRKCSLGDDSTDSITLASESRLRELGLFVSFFVILTSILFFFLLSVILL